MKRFKKSRIGKKGIAAVELALILPMLVLMAFGIIDLGRLIQASLIVTNVSREGGSMASRGFRSGDDLLNMLQSSGTPLALNESGKIYISRIRAGTSTTAPNPFIDSQISKGNLAISSNIHNNLPGLGLSDGLYQHLIFEDSQQSSDIAETWVVEVYYNYQPITPLPNFITGILVTPGYNGRIIGSKSVF